MRKVHDATSLADAHMVANELRAHEIGAVVRGESDPLHPPTVWVEHDGDEERALAVISAVDGPATPPGAPSAPARSRRRPRPIVVALAASLALNGWLLLFDRPDDPPRGRWNEEWDTNGDGRADAWAEHEGERVLADARDVNFDGVPDDRTFHEPDGVAYRREYDADLDGRIDAWESYRGGQIESGRYDNDRDGVADEWVKYRFFRPVEKSWSFRNDGKVDKRAFYEGGRKVREEYDRDRDGVFEETVAYDPFERVVGRRP